MRFGSFLFPVSHHSERDGEVIDRALREVEVAEEVGLDAVWLTEHHFSGEVAYADPVVFGAAAAARTESVLIGFAVVEMALHHPVRLAAQTALLDNLSHGRLIVGTGRGSAINHFEYAGFGMTMQEGFERLDEAEELLVKAWTADDLDFRGRYWRASLPILRPRPYQKPHPPLVRACLGEGSTVAMAGEGRPVLLAPLADAMVEDRLRKYRDALSEAGYDEPEAGRIYDQVWVTKNIVVASSLDEAAEIAEYGFRREMEHGQEVRRRYNPEGGETTTAALLAGQSFEETSIVGAPRQVADHLAALRDLGVPNLMLKFNIGEMTVDHVERSMRLFGAEVAPLFRGSAPRG